MLKLFNGTNSKVSTDSAKIDDILSRGVEEIFVRENLEKRLKSGQKLRIKLGIDPTGKNIHIGRASILWKLRAFQDLGHQVVLIVGDFTAQIGDASDKLEKRPMLSTDKIAENLADYSKQLGKIINMKKAEVVYNSKWLSKLKFDEICQLAESFTVQQMINRRNFKDRIESGTEISLREFMYPLMQGYDSVAVHADVELGGFDQLFNLKAGRAIQKHYGQTEQDIMVLKMLLGTDGRKMSTSWGNVININDTPQDMFGKTMAVRDDLMKDYFLICTDMPMVEVEQVSVRLEKGENPRDIKLELAEKITARYHGAEDARKAREAFIKTFSEKKIPNDVLVADTLVDTPLVNVMMMRGIVDSKSEWRRLVLENAVTDAETGAVISDPNAKALKTQTLKVGKRRFIKIEVAG